MAISHIFRKLPEDCSIGAPDLLNFFQMTKLPYDPRLPLPEALAKDVLSLRRTGYRPTLEPRTLPALAELSRALSKETEATYAVAVSSALGLAISRSAASLTAVFPVVRREIIEGLIKLFGLSSESPRRVQDRYNQAGPHLGSPDGYEQLRHADTAGTRRLAAAMGQIAAELSLLAEEADFAYRRLLFPTTALLRTNIQSSTPTVSINPAPTRGINAWFIGDILREAEVFDKGWLANIKRASPDVVTTILKLRARVSSELRLLVDVGVDALPVPGVITMYAGFHHFYGYPRAASAREVASLLIEQIYMDGGYGRPYIGNGVLEFFGLGRMRYHTREQCREMAAWYLGYQHGNDLLGEFTDRIIDMLTNRMVRSMIRYGTNFDRIERFIDSLDGDDC
jgi:hypothetical protein